MADGAGPLYFDFALTPGYLACTCLQYTSLFILLMRLLVLAYIAGFVLVRVIKLFLPLSPLPSFHKLATGFMVLVKYE